MNGGAASRSVGSLIAVVALAVVVLVGCGADATTDEVGRPQFEAHVEAELGTTAEQSACITDRAFDAYEPDEIRTILDEGITAIPSRIGPYVYAIVTCTMGEDVQR